MHDPSARALGDDFAAIRDRRIGKGAVVTIKPRSGAIDMKVTGCLDETGSRALLDAVEAAIEVRDAVVVELDATEALSGETLRNLAACASRGALLRFNRTVGDRETR